MTEKARFHFSAVQGIVEIEGSEEFVSKHFEALADIAKMMARHTHIDPKLHNFPKEEVSPSNLTANEENQDTSESINTYPQAFAEINEKLKIVMDIPGDNKRHQMSNMAILYCYGSSLMGEEQVSSKDLREACEEHGIIDSPNFSKIFEDKTIFLSDGAKGGTKDIKLTHQGRKRAKELLLNNGNS